MKLLFKLLKHSKKYWKYLLISIAAMVMIIISQLYAPLLLRDLIKVITVGQEGGEAVVLRLSLILCLIYLVQAIGGCLRSYYTHYAAWNFVSDLRIIMYDHLQSLSLKYYNDKQTGQLMSRTANDTNNLEMLIAHALPDLIVNSLLIVGICCILFFINVNLALLSLIPVPFIVASTVWFAKKVYPKFRLMQQKFAEFNATIHDNFSGMKEIQAFNKQKSEHERVTFKSKDHIKTMMESLKLSAIYHPFIQLFSSLGSVIVFGVGGLMVLKGTIPVQDIVAFVLYLSMFYQPISSLARTNEDLQTALASAERIFEVLDAESDVKETENPIKLGRVEGHINFENVSFKYLDSVEVLKDINISVKKGDIIALVGPTGVGKTTIASLLERYYDPIEGRILIDGIDIKNVTLESLRNNISIVLQDIFLFNGTIAENVSYGVNQATMDEIVGACKLANAHEFIENLESGYNTIIGERGIRLSGGQKQRISIARAVLRDSPILILDEATSSVDVNTEKIIHEAMDSIVQGRTTIIIAHRLSSVKKANMIIVLDEGSVKECGTHEELIAAGGLYEELCNIQFNQSSEEE